MDNSSGSDSDFSDSEIDVYAEKPYKLLMNETYKVKVNGLFKCPFCSRKKKQFYKYKELLAHASAVAKGKKNPKEKAKHFALVKYFENELAADAEVPSLSKQPQEVKSVSEIYVQPWIGIVICPMRTNDNTNLLLSSDYWFNELDKFKPLEVKTLWIGQDSVVAVVAEFKIGWSGFNSATELEKYYEIKHCGRKEWTDKEGDWRSKTYGWCAREDDYNSQGLIAEYLSTVGRLKSFSDITNEELLSSNIVGDDLVEKINMKNEILSTVEFNNKRKVIFLDQAYKEETKRFHENSWEKIHMILAKKQRLSSELECKMQDLIWSKELEKKEALTEHARQNIDEEKKKFCAKNLSLNLASEVQKKTDDSMLRVLEEHQRKKKEALNNIFQLEKVLANKQKLRIDIQELQGK